MFKKFKTQEGEVFEAFRCKKKNVRKIFDMPLEELSETKLKLIIELAALFCGIYNGLIINKEHWIVIDKDDNFCVFGHYLFKNKFKKVKE